MSSWCEGCSCHTTEHAAKTYHLRRKRLASSLAESADAANASADSAMPSGVAPTCVFKGRRAPELAGDLFLTQVGWGH
eukprot:407575-Alexandrium_andersonii.AAC.1